MLLEAEPVTRKRRETRAKKTFSVLSHPKKKGQEGAQGGPGETGKNDYYLMSCLEKCGRNATYAKDRWAELEGGL